MPHHRQRTEESDVSTTEKSTITPRSQDHATWYQDVIREADLAEPAEVVKGCMVIKPHGYAIWEKIQAQLDRRFKDTGHKNAYFPLFIPESFLKREAQHVEGFSPELAVVTIGGGKELEEKYVVRPTSETIIGYFFAKWVSSWRDLPLLINQWANVVRWELRTRMFLRTTEFLWQEGHTAHASHDEAQAESLRMLDIYAEFAEGHMAMPVIKGRKTDSEKFAGAERSYCIEAMMENGLALQAGTSHDLGQNFGKAFDVKFQNKDKELEFVWQTSWGVSTRLIGGLVMTHSDDAGLVLPPKLAPIHVAIVPIYRKDEEREAVYGAADRIAGELRDRGLAVEVDKREEYKPGFKYFYWERRGVPVRIEIGPRDLAAQQVVLKRRDRPEKENAPMAGLAEYLTGLMERIQQDLLAAARRRLDENTMLVDELAAFDKLMEPITAERGGGKFVMAHWCGSRACEDRIKETKATIRCVPFEDRHGGGGKCLVCGSPSPQRVVVAKAY
jgi:prolyl-tRNA synthetase